MTVSGGTFTTASDVEFTVGANDQLVVTGNSTVFTVAYRATVEGSISKVGAATVQAAGGAEYFRAIATTATDFIAKNAMPFFTHLRLAGAATFDNDVTIGITNLEFYANATFAGQATITSTTVTSQNDALLTVNANALLKMGPTKLDSGTGTKIKAMPTAAVHIGGARYFYASTVETADLSVATG